MNWRSMLLVIVAACALSAQASATILYLTVSGTVTDGEDIVTTGDPFSSPVTTTTPYHQGDPFVATFHFDTDNPNLSAPADEMLAPNGSSLAAELANGKPPSPKDGFGIAYSGSSPSSYPVARYFVNKTNLPGDNEFSFEFDSDQIGTQQAVFQLSTGNDIFSKNTIYEGFTYTTQPGDSFSFFLDSSSETYGGQGAYRLQNLFVGTDNSAGVPVTITVSTGALPSVPEPASWALMSLGLGMAGASLRSARGGTLRHRQSGERRYASA